MPELVPKTRNWACSPQPYFWVRPQALISDLESTNSRAGPQTLILHLESKPDLELDTFL